jgi:hypothetical protein
MLAFACVTLVVGFGLVHSALSVVKDFETSSSAN